MAVAAGTTDPMFVLTATANVEQVTKLSGSTTRDQAEYFSLVRWHPGLILADVVRSKLSQCIGNGERCLIDRQLLLVFWSAKQLVDDVAGIGVGNIT